MLKQFYEENYQRLCAELKVITENEHDPLKKMRAGVNAAKAALSRLRDFVAEHPFADKAETICCFKYEKPRLESWLIYAVELFHVENGVPLGWDKSVKHYLLSELAACWRMIRVNEFYYQYYKQDMSEMDGLLFVPGEEMPSLVIPELVPLEDGFSTMAGYLFARFRAYERLALELIARLKKLRPVAADGGAGKPKKDFRWTGENLNLIELLHGIHLTGQVNDGEAGIVELFKGMGEFFGVDLGIPKKGLDGLMKRKKLSRTHYTDRVRDSLNKRMDEEDDWEREKRLKNKSGF